MAVEAGAARHRSRAANIHALTNRPGFSPVCVRPSADSRTAFARSDITLLEELLKRTAEVTTTTGVPDLGGIRLKRRSGRESSQHARRFPPTWPDGTIAARALDLSPVRS